MTDPTTIALAREVLALAEKATPGPMFVELSQPDKAYVTLEEWGTYARRGRVPPGDDRDESDLIVAEFERDQDDRHEDNARLYAHAGTHYAAIARALLQAQEENERLREALVYLDRILAFSPVSHETREFVRNALRPVAPSEKDGRSE